MKSSNHNYVGYAIATCVSIFFCAYVLINRYAYQFEHVDGYTYIATFLAVAGIAGMCDLLFFAGPRQTVRIFLTEKKNVNPTFAPLAIYGGLTTLAFAIAAFGQQHTTATNASLIFSANMVPTALCAWLIWNQILSGTSVLSMGIVLVGLYVAVIGFTSYNVHTGDVLILIAACTIGFTNAYLKRLIKDYPSRVLANIRLIVGAVAGSVFLVFHHVDFLSRDNLLFALAAGLSLWASVNCVAAAMRRIDVNTTIVLAQTHIIMTPIAAVFILDEKYRYSTLVGSIIMLVGVILFARSTVRRSPFAEQNH